MSEPTGAQRQPTSHERRAGVPWDASYLDGPAPWDVGPQPAIVRLAAEGAFAGAVLDAGCGSGDNALHLDSVGQAFEAVLDCGLFHSFDSDERRDYVTGLASVTKRGGHLHLLCFGDAGPHPVAQEELHAAFARSGDWAIASISPDRIQTRFAAQGVPAWLAKIERI